MAYTLMTGGTGLLGAYLLRDGLLQQRRFAVIARRSKVESARQRIESILARFEEDLDCRLGRPVVLEGDLSQPGLGLTAVDIAWVQQHCDRFLHNAASLTFYQDEKTGEPERSNVEGTRNALELCRETDIKDFHHVSTAYVCGLRTGICREDELDVGQQLGNDYEITKVAAEKMVRDADFLRVATFYRPAIIVGDAVTGYTSSFHGFFTPLKVASALVESFAAGRLDGSPIMQLLGLKGHEQKNYVPVDWVSAVMTHLMGQQQFAGKTYHLTPQRRVTIKTTLRVMEDAIERFREGRQIAGVAPEGPPDFSMFREQMEVYRTYWRNDPEFDSTNTTTAAPHLPCPMLSHACLMRMAMYALDAGFGWPAPSPVVPQTDFADRLSIAQDAFRQSEQQLGLSVVGPGGGDWTLHLASDGSGVVSVGVLDEDAPVLHTTTESFAACLGGTATAKQLIDAGAVHLESSLDETAARRRIEAAFRALQQLQPADLVEATA